MTKESTHPVCLGAIKERKPALAANLSFVLAGLGQIYCGCVRRGVVHMAIVAALLVTAILLLSLEFAAPLSVCLVLGVLTLGVTCYSAFDARQAARRTRADYRLKDYNCITVYLAVSFLFMAVVGGFALSVRDNFIELFVMAGDSMSPTLGEGEKVLVRKDVYRDRDPERNELVAFRNPSNRRQKWIKRVIGLPGDRVEIKAGAVHINGEPIEEVATVMTDTAMVAPTIVPEDHCYVLGDHRARSRDSRHIGPVPMIALLGKVAFVR